jgi:ribosomal subunit interface protein
MTPSTAKGGQVAAEFDIEISARGAVRVGERRYAEEKLARIAKFAPRPIIHARAILSEESNPSVERPATAEAILDVSGRIVRAHVAAAQMREAVDMLEDRLRRLLEELSDMYRTRRRANGQTEVSSARPAFSPRPVEEREVVVHKTFADEPQTPEEAALDMRLLDFDFYLFKNVRSGEDNVLYRVPDGPLGWLQVTPGADPGDGYALELQPDHAPAPTIAVEEATSRLDASGEPFVFFVDPSTGRGSLVYRRYDGNYGLIRAADD